MLVLKEQSRKQEATATLTSTQLREVISRFLGDLCIVNFTHYFFNENADIKYAGKLMFRKHSTAIVIEEAGYNFRAEMPWNRIKSGIIDSTGNLNLSLNGDATWDLSVTNDLRDALLKKY